jgi:alkanesulfonate monooxygenase SsuD/methylene tetrahydromethanopterin reductase-like flavin-dependent oxidoreductase (luciferase family)
VKFSVWPSYDRSWDETITLARWAEANGFDGYWYADHLMPYRADGTPDPGDALECWTVLAAVGALVPRLRLVSMVSPVTIHHPVLLAKRAITTSHVAGGRVVLGLGAGWQVNEHSAYGFDLPEPGPRVSRFAEAIEVIHGLVHDDAVTFHGTYYSLTDAPCSPKPVGALPLLVGTGSPRMLRLTARWADEWNTWGDPDEVARRTDRFHAACEAVGRDPGTVRRSAQAMVHLDGSAEGALAGRSLVGNAEQLVALFTRYAELGVDEFAFPDDTLGDSPAERLDTLGRLHAEVMPHVP